MGKHQKIQQLFEEYKQTSESRKEIYKQIIQVEEQKAKLQKELDQLQKIYDQSIEKSDFISDQIDQLILKDE